MFCPNFDRSGGNWYTKMTQMDQSHFNTEDSSIKKLFRLMLVTTFLSFFFRSVFYSRPMWTTNSCINSYSGDFFGREEEKKKKRALRYAQDPVQKLISASITVTLLHTLKAHMMQACIFRNLFFVDGSVQKQPDKPRRSTKR